MLAHAGGWNVCNHGVGAVEQPRVFTANTSAIFGEPLVINHIMALGRSIRVVHDQTAASLRVLPCIPVGAVQNNVHLRIPFIHLPNLNSRALGFYRLLLFGRPCTIQDCSLNRRLAAPARRCAYSSVTTIIVLENN